MLATGVNRYGISWLQTLLLAVPVAAVLLRSGTSMGQELPASTGLPGEEEPATSSRPTRPAPGVFQPFSGSAAGLPPSQAVAPGQRIIVPRSATYLPSSLPLPERLGAGRGYRLGSFALQAVTSTGLAYDDNINATDKDRESDFIWSLQQGVRAQSLFRRHSLGFQATAGTSRYFEHSSDSSINWLVGTDGRLDFTPRSSLSGFLTYTRDKESPEEPGASSDSSDNAYHLFNGGLSYNQQFRRFTWSLGSNASRTEYENGDDNGRDSWSYGASTSLGYLVSDRLSIFLSPAYSRTTYDESMDESGEEQDSHGYSVSAGANYEVGPRLSANGSVGYSWLFADDDTQGVIFNGGLHYVIDGKTSTDLRAFRSIGDTDVDGASAEISTGVTLGVTRVLRPDMAVGLTLGASRNELEGIDSKNDAIFATLGYGYAFNDSLTFSAGYRYTQQFSSGDDSNDEQGLDSYYRNVFFIGVSLRI
ncbi:MAG: outer membrane beta-barrel protein [Geminicoccaceae bacterium]